MFANRKTDQSIKEPLPANTRLASLVNEIHVFPTSFTLLNQKFEYYQGLLAQNEIKKFAQYPNPQYSRQCILSRGFLRELLSSYLEIPPREIIIEDSKYKKPEIKNALNELEFNVSHSQDKIIIAIAMGRKVGVDLEKLDLNKDWQNIYPLVFSEQEQNQLTSLIPEQQISAFYRGWTQKEAFLKAIGSGFNLNPQEFSFDLDSESVPTLIRSRRSDDLKHWELQVIPELDSYIGMLAYERKGPDSPTLKIKEAI
jgi:4'-phosphopantetheinyl transferase